MATHTRNLRHGSLQLRDGAGTPKKLTVPIEQGNLTFDESTPGVVVKHRGALDHWSLGEEHEVPVSFTILYNEYGSKSTAALSTTNSTISVRDFLRGTFSGLTTTSGRTDVYTCDLWFTISNPVTSGDEQEILKFTQFRCESLKFAEGAEANTIACSGRALLTTPVSARS